VHCRNDARGLNATHPAAEFADGPMPAADAGDTRRAPAGGLFLCCIAARRSQDFPLDSATALCALPNNMIHFRPVRKIFETKGQ